MSDNNGSGIFGTLLVGLGLAGMIVFAAKAATQLNKRGPVFSLI